MARREARPPAQREVRLTPRSEECVSCGKRLWVAYHAQRTLMTLRGLVRLRLVVRRCRDQDCDLYHLPYRAEEEGAWALLPLSLFPRTANDAPLRRINERHDVVAVVVSDPREERFPAGALARIVDAEEGGARLVDLGRADVGRRAAARAQQLERRFRASGVDWIEVSTAVPYDRDLLRFFRERRVRKG